MLMITLIAAGVAVVSSAFVFQSASKLRYSAFMDFYITGAII